MPMQNDNEVNTQGNRKMNNIGLPTKEGWNTSDVMACGDEDSVDDAPEVMMDLWHEYANMFEAHLIDLVEESKTTEMMEDDGLMLIRKFSNYPARPVLQPGFPMVKQGNRAWNQWANHVEEIFTTLRQGLARGKQTERVQESFSAVDDKVPGVQGMYTDMDHSPRHVASILCALLHLRGVDTGSGGSKIDLDELADGIERLCLEGGTHINSRGLIKEMALRLKSEREYS